MSYASTRTLMMRGLQFREFAYRFMDENPKRKTANFVFFFDEKGPIPSDYPWIFRGEKQAKRFQRLPENKGREAAIIHTYKDGDDLCVQYTYKKGK